METRPVASGRRAPPRGRAEECGRLDGLLADVRRGKSRSLVVRGEAGIGKTALLEYLIGSASEMTVLRAVGVESEMELAYASLHQFCAPLLDRLKSLPDPQRDALRVVFGLAGGAPPDRYLVGLGVLSLLSAAAEERPLLCVVDDAQWLDRASASTLAFVARRLLAERVGIVFAAREPGEELQHLSGMEVPGLRNGDARALLRTAVRFVLDESVRERIIAETRGNPLALVELPRGLTASELAGGFGLADGQALRGRIEESFIRRLEALPEETRRLLLLAAADPVGDPILLWHAAERLRIDPRAADQAVDDGLLAIGERVIFRHPLIRSAAYRSVAAEDRRAVHHALAEATDRVADPDRRAWHLAAATSGPDEEVAAELERSAGRAQARGGVAAAAAFLRRSVALTLDPARRAERCLAAAHAHLQAGAFDEALRLLASAEEGAVDELGQARHELLAGQIAFASNYGGNAAERLLKAARRLEPLDPTLARETYLNAWAAAMMAGKAGAKVLPEVSAAALSALPLTSTPCLMDLLLKGLALLVSEGRAAAAPALNRAVSAVAAGELPTTERLQWGWYGALAAGAAWDLENWGAITDRLTRAAREAGLLVEQLLHLTGVGMVASFRGEFSVAASAAAEIDAIAEATGSQLNRAAAVQLAAWRGREAEAITLIKAEQANASALGQGIGVQVCQWASSVLYNGLGRYDLALVEAQQAGEVSPELWISGWALVEEIEAATRTGNTELASEALERLTAAASVADTDWRMGVVARSRALLTEGEVAEDAYREAIERLTRTRLRPELARAHLLYGEWLRRENRRVDARSQLRLALELFTAIGMEAFADRARSELQATGEHVRAHTVETRDDLTAQERQIAELARDGLTNPEIGARLFLSPRTVEWHLRHVYTKLGIRSRRALADALPNTSAEKVLA
jgi:DNA-binding CsgD family transcriptional regulator